MCVNYNWESQAGVFSFLFFSWQHHATNGTDRIHQSSSSQHSGIPADHDHCVLWCNIQSWTRERIRNCMFHPHSPTMVVCSSPKANIAIIGAVSHCQTWHRWSIQPIGLRTLDMNIHAGELNPPPAPRPAVQSASSAGIEWESILWSRLLLLLLLFKPHLSISTHEI